MALEVTVHMTYLGFHAVFILPCIAVLMLLWLRQPSFQDRRIWQGIATIIVLAVLYATPWDNWLVMEGIWTYAPNAVIATLAYVPVEEYLFFILQPILTGLWLRWILVSQRPNWVEGRPSAGIWLGVAFWLICAAVSALLLAFAGPQWRYMGMIFVWVSPVLALQWAVGGRQLWANARIWALGIVPPTLYLAIADRIAIAAGVWHITEATSTGFLIAGLPIEEFLFFLVTNIMIVQGVLLFVWVVQTGHLATVWRYFSLPVAPQTMKLSDRTHLTVQQVVIAPAALILACVAFFFLLPIALPIEAQLIPLLLSAVFIGLPHGAVDHLVPGMLAGKSIRPHQMAVLIAGYLVLIAIVLGLWLLSPLVGFVFFIGLTWWHWGTADLHATLAFHRASFLDTKPSRFLTAFVRGGLPMFVPLLFFPDDYRLALDSITALFTSASVDPLNGIFSSQFRVVGGLLFAAAMFLSIALAFSASAGQDAHQQGMIYSGETILLGFYFAVVPPFLAIGLYFCLWHSMRHIARLILLDASATAPDMSPRQFASGFVRFIRSAAPLTMVSLVFLAGLYLIVPSSPDDLLSLIALYLVLICGLTLPHSLIVLWMDMKQGVWRLSRQAKQAEALDHLVAAPVIGGD